MEEKKIFIIHSLKLIKEALLLEKELGEPCYVPGRDTEQTQGDHILKQNLEGMLRSDIVYVIWDGQSQGTLFDMGMAYALGIPIKPFKLVYNRSWISFFVNKLKGEILYGRKEKQQTGST